MSAATSGASGIRGAITALLGSRKFLLASVAAGAGILGFYDVLPLEVVGFVVAWAAVLITTITAEDVAEKL